jgi:hypothetical protein
VYCYWILERQLKFKPCPESTSLYWEQFSTPYFVGGILVQIVSGAAPWDYYCVQP